MCLCLFKKIFTNGLKVLLRKDFYLIQAPQDICFDVKSSFVNSIHEFVVNDIGI